MSFNNLHFCKFLSVFLLFGLPTFGLNLDGTLLLSFKYHILSDPLSVLDNWDYNDATPCLWNGVACAEVQNNFGNPDMFRVVSLTLPSSELLGIIPEELGLIPHLKTLDLSNNFFNGTLPNSLFNASEIQVLSLSNNAISGVMPEFVSGAKSLKLLNFSGNGLAGRIPQSIAYLQNLTVVSLRSNHLSGQIPNGIQSIEIFDLSSNLLTGLLPVEFGGDNLKYLNLSSNKLSGSVPPQFAEKIPGNATIDLSFNDLAGEIPESMALSNQKTECFAGNAELCGKPLKKLCNIPSSLTTPLNFSTNSSSPAIAAIPKTIGTSPLPNSPLTTQNPDKIQVQNGLKPGAIAGIAIVPVAGMGLLAMIFLYIYQQKKKANPASKEGASPNIKAYEFKKDSERSSVVKESRNLSIWTCLSITNGEETSEATGSDSDENSNHVVDHPQINNHSNKKSVNLKNERALVMVDGETELGIETLFKASAYVLGSNSAAIVYKAVLQDGTAFAVRRIGESGGVKRVKDFENRIRAIAKLRHRNLVTVRGFYWGDDEKLVICDYISNGSLASVGYRKFCSSPCNLAFETRLKIANGVARGLAYIHVKKNVHGNIKPSNILLTDDMEPIISDFGLHLLVYGKPSHKSHRPSRHFGSKKSSSSNDDLHGSSSQNIGPAGFVGCTSPYHAPESLDNLKPNPKWDVYSFGILLLELLTGKVFSDRELSQWTSDSVAKDPGRVLRMTDVAIRGDVAAREEAILELLKLGFGCASLVPQKRPCMKDALNVLEKFHLVPNNDK